MPTVPRRPAAQRERERLEARRLRAAELFAAGVRQAEVARQLAVSAQAVSAWHARWQAGGTKELRSKAPSGPTPRLSDAQLRQVEQVLLEGAMAAPSRRSSEKLRSSAIMAVALRCGRGPGPG